MALSGRQKAAILCVSLGSENAAEIFKHLPNELVEQLTDEILSRLSAVIELTPFQFLSNTPPDQIHAFLRNEHPQTIALVVAQLPSTELAARVVELFDPEDQAEIAVRIAQMGQTSPDVVKEVAQV